MKKVPTPEDLQKRENELQNRESKKRKDGEEEKHFDRVPNCDASGEL